MVVLVPLPTELSKRTKGYQAEKARKVRGVISLHTSHMCAIRLHFFRRTSVSTWLFKVSYPWRIRAFPIVLIYVHLVLETIRTVKLLGWEKVQASKLEGARKEELDAARKVIMMQIWIGCIKYVRTAPFHITICANSAPLQRLYPPPHHAGELCNFRKPISCSSPATLTSHPDLRHES